LLRNALAEFDRLHHANGTAAALAYSRQALAEASKQQEAGEPKPTRWQMATLLIIGFFVSLGKAGW